MSKLNLSSHRSSRRSAQTATPLEIDLPKSVKFTIDNEDVHEVSLNWENEGQGEEQSART